MAKLQQLNHKTTLRRRGLTLVEVLIALALFSLMFIGMMDFWKSGINSFSAGSGQADNLQQIRLTLAHFEKDMREAMEVVHYEDNADHTTLQIRKISGLVDNPIDVFIIYTYYKKTVDLGNYGQMPGALCREEYSEQQDPSVLARKPAIRAVDKALSGNRVGIVHEAENGLGQKIHCYIYAYNIYYDPGYQDKEFLSPADKEAMAARARFKNIDSATGGFDKLDDIVAFEIQFLVNDDRNNLKQFRQVIYIRSLFYQQVYDM